MNTLPRLTAALSLAVALSACAGSASTTAGRGTRTLPFHESQPTVRVENNHWSDMTVYAVQRGVRVRLGTVTSMSSSVFRLPRHAFSAGSDVRLVADPIGGNGGFVSHGLQLSGGQQVRMTLQNHLAISHVSVY